MLFMLSSNHDLIFRTAIALYAITVLLLVPYGCLYGVYSGIWGLRLHARKLTKLVILAAHIKYNLVAY